MERKDFYRQELKAPRKMDQGKMDQGKMDQGKRIEGWGKEDE
jgi:hypothetical protein